MIIDLINKTATEIDLLKVEKEKELQTAQENLFKIELEELEIAKEIIILQGKRKDFQIAMAKAKQIVKTLLIDIRILTSYFWNAKNP